MNLDLVFHHVVILRYIFFEKIFEQLVCGIVKIIANPLVEHAVRIILTVRHEIFTKSKSLTALVFEIIEQPELLRLL